MSDSIECRCGHCGHRFDAVPMPKHKVACLDVLAGDAIGALARGEAVELLATDPPYNVGLDYNQDTDDEKSAEAYREFTQLWFEIAASMTERQVVTPGCNNLSLWLRLFAPYHVAPWVKTNAMTNGKVSRFWCWEPVLFFGEHWPRGRPNDVFDFPAGMHKDTGGHPCPKPVRMWADLIANYASEGAAVLDVFLGSGTTLVAAEQTGRRCLGLDISPSYIDISLTRWRNLTGKMPILESSGQTFEEVKHERIG